MYGPSQEEFLSKVRDALLALKEANVSAAGPFTTPKKNRVYVIGDCILNESEIVVLHEGGHFSAENVGKLLNDLKSLQSNQPRELKPLNEPTLRNRRRSERVMLQVALLVRAEMGTGKRVQTQAFTVEVNAHGGVMESPYKMTVGQRITLVNPESGKEVSCTVVRVERLSAECFWTAFAFDQPNSRFWPVRFPALDWGEA